MSDYAAPLEELAFSLVEVNGFGEHYSDYGLTEDDVWAVLREAAKFAERELAPLNAIGDKEGVKFNKGEVLAPTGFKEAYQKYVAGGWPALAQPLEYGGQALPPSLSLCIAEIFQAANQSFCMYAKLGEGACETLLNFGSNAVKRDYLPHLVSGRWTSTMCLTEAHAGSDLSLLRTKAEPCGDGLYQIYGSKVFISSGEHDLAENIVHLVLARLPGAPSGTRGISLFLVPKRLVKADGSLGDANNISCGSIEHKMGLRGSATCVMNFDGAEGYLVGPANRGLACMFVFMNASRLGTAIQGQAQADAALQMSLVYANERIQGSTNTGRDPAGSRSKAIISHPDVQRMLLTQQVFSEGGRAFLFTTP